MDFSPVTADSIAITVVYSVLILWGVWVGVRQVHQGFNHPEALLNPLFGNRQAIKIFTFHLIVVSSDLFVIGPMALHYKSRLVVLGRSSRAVVGLVSRSRSTSIGIRSRSGKLIGHVGEISKPLRDLAPRPRFSYRSELVLLLRFALLARGVSLSRRWSATRAPDLVQHAGQARRAPLGAEAQLGRDHTIYVLAALAVYYRKVIFAAPPDDARPEHVATLLEGILVVGMNVGVAMLSWGMTRKYTGPGPGAGLDPSGRRRLDLARRRAGRQGVGGRIPEVKQKQVLRLLRNHQDDRRSRLSGCFAPSR
jgi:hypothetical protein